MIDQASAVKLFIVALAVLMVYSGIVLWKQEYYVVAVLDFLAGIILIESLRQGLNSED